MFSWRHGLHLRHWNGLQAFWHRFLAPLQITADSYVFPCFLAPCQMGVWLPDLTNVLCLWEAQTPSFCDQLCSSSQAEASHRYPGAIGQIWGIFNLKRKHHFRSCSWEGKFCFCVMGVADSSLGLLHWLWKVVLVNIWKTFLPWSFPWPPAYFLIIQTLCIIPTQHYPHSKRPYASLP